MSSYLGERLVQSLQKPSFSALSSQLFLQWSNGPNVAVRYRKDFLSCCLWQLYFTFKWPHVQHFGYRMICKSSLFSALGKFVMG